MFPENAAYRGAQRRGQLFNGWALALALLATGGCQSSPVTRSGYLTTYAGLPAPDAPLKGGAHRRRDDKASDGIQQVFIEPAVLGVEIEAEFSEKEKTMVLREVDRQICFEVSKRFLIASVPSPEAAMIRTAVVRMRSNSRVGSVADAAIDFVNPIPVMTFRLPSTTGGLAIESELLDARGAQVAAITWRRNALMIGRIKPSLSKAGDALQLAEPFGDAVAKAFASEDRPRIKIAEPDPCDRFGLRKNIKRSLASGVVGGATGLYMPQVAGTSARETKEGD
jgi:hypothetical protein